MARYASQPHLPPSTLGGGMMPSLTPLSMGRQLQQAAGAAKPNPAAQAQMPSATPATAQGISQVAQRVQSAQPGASVTGEEVVLFTLAESPDYRQPTKR